MSNTPAHVLLPTKHADRADAMAVLQRLRDEGHVAYFAGGCVRDLLLGREPKDWDIATDAPPMRVRQIFPRTQAVGAAFGVILVRHRKSQVEVATFRSDGRYLDGRHPEEVTFTTAEEDAKRRDFTINGLFLDPIKDEVIDFVGGQADLKAKVIRAIGDPNRRFDEDYLRMLRAVRFAARLGFSIDATTATAIQRNAPFLIRISPERVADELRAMLPPITRLSAWRMLHDLSLLPVVFRFADVPPGSPDEDRSIDGLFSKLAPNEPIPIALALAAAAIQWLWWASPATVPFPRCFEKSVVSNLVGAMRKSLRLSNEESETAADILDGLHPMTGETIPGVATLKRFLARPTAALSRKLLLAAAAANLVETSHVETIEAQLADLEKTEFAPTPLITGDDLTAAGMRPGPLFKRMLEVAYDAQLEGKVSTLHEALALAKSVVESSK